MCGGGSICSLLVSATWTNETTEPNEFTKMMIHQHSSFPGQLTQAGFHITFHTMLSVVRRDLMWGFFTGAGGRNSTGVTIHTNSRMGHLKTSQGHCAGMIPTAWWGSCSCSSAATFSGLAVSPTGCKKQRTHIHNFQLLKEEFHPEKMKFTWAWINKVTWVS